MENKIKALITKLKNENKDRTIAMSDPECNSYSDYRHNVLLHKYNNTLEIIKQLEDILN